MIGRRRVGVRRGRGGIGGASQAASEKPGKVEGGRGGGGEKGEGRKGMNTTELWRGELYKLRK